MYLDPGIGSMVIQLIVAGLAMLGGVWVVFKKRIVAFIRRKRGLESPADPAGEVADAVTADPAVSGAAVAEHSDERPQA